MDQLEYARFIGCLMYVMTFFRPNIAILIGRLSRDTSNPSHIHWIAVQKKIKYL